MDGAKSSRRVRSGQISPWRVPSRRPPGVARSTILPGLRPALLPPLAPGELEPEAVMAASVRARRKSKGEDTAAATPRRSGAEAWGAVRRVPCHKSHNCDREARSDTLTGSEIRTAEALAGNVAAIAALVGIERVGFFTITLADDLSYYDARDWREAQRRLHNWLRKGLPGTFGAGARWLSVVEPQHVRGAIHWHFLIECPGDIRTGFNWDSARAGRWRETGASACLKRLWAKLRKGLPAYGLGRHELLPVRSSAEAIACYVGKYIGKSVGQESWHEHVDGKVRPWRARRVRYSQGWRRWSGQFMSVEAGREWRIAVARVAAECRFNDLRDFRERLGPRWAFLLRDVILPGKGDGRWSCDACGVGGIEARYHQCPVCGERRIKHALDDAGGSPGERRDGVGPVVLPSPGAPPLPCDGG